MTVVSQTCPVDLEDGLARAGDDREFYKELLEIFLEDLPDRIGELRQALDAGDGENVARAAHSIKGAAANLSAHVIRETAFKIEQSGRAGDLGDVPSILEQLEGEVDRLSAFADDF